MSLSIWNNSKERVLLVLLPQVNKIHSLIDHFYYRTTTAVAFHHALMMSYHLIFFNLHRYLQ